MNLVFCINYILINYNKNYSILIGIESNCRSIMLNEKMLNHLKSKWK